MAYEKYIMALKNMFERYAYIGYERGYVS